MAKKFFKLILLNRWSALVHDLTCVPLALTLAYWLRFNLGPIPLQYQQSLLTLILFAVPVQGIFFWYSGLYRGLWRFASIPDLVRIFKVVGLGSLVILAITFLWTRLQGIPRSVFLLYPLLLVAGLSASRIAYRWYKDNRLGFSSQEGTRTLIVGAGRAGEMLVRDLLHRVEYHPLAFLDDTPGMYKREIHGVPVQGGTHQLGDICRLLSVELVLFAIPSANKALLQRLVLECNQIGVRCQTLPSVFEMAGHQVDAKKLRSVTVEDLLGREVVELDYDAIAGYLTGKVVLVTGGGGSIGSELCRQIAAQKPAQLIVFDNGEFNLYTIEYELRHSLSNIVFDAVLGDVKNQDRVNWLFKTYRPDVVYHAAAYKHVPMVEANPVEGVGNNIFGTKVVADAADRYSAGRFVLVSTDKAVNPVNVMGATKRIAEIYCQNLNSRSKTQFITTRFGNVLGSAGSVVPLFQKQIEKGGPVTVTHKDITRYFMTIPESVSLILQAGAMGGGGEIFVLDMGKPVLIHDLAKQMIQLSGLKVEKDIKIVYTGLRPGEKLYEELLHESEVLKRTTHEKLFLAHSRNVDWSWLGNQLAELERVSVSRDVGKMLTIMHDIVPEFKE
ncbi:MAG: polysaccharide biosynthesis protein [Proteobacteria bacterium]|jgi:FlaA1/EpsC-like NDP-sugar epimerase|nr:polysaccharide biosynthesis protein [Desulfocapsa sp.]MBU3946003.1 polysaccharide biosynthesis protein [Pseudomonadota bacterium]MCG2743076.1 polysaccharide biosynthesis protein [Desulfobacteraceae bacterium]MBU4030152.1 polysaccharide biosynthesis protein [Pseudomonadota bacterium]MBU4043776.1 polysaccharide biosynthesis protein [Pseudomonadota bacterium]